MTEVCGKCGAPANPAGSYWFAPNDLWNEVNGSPNGFRCIACFTEECEARGIVIGWRADRVGDIEELSRV
jgi:hypothetical protein